MTVSVESLAYDSEPSGQLLMLPEIPGETAREHDISKAYQLGERIAPLVMEMEGISSLAIQEAAIRAGKNHFKLEGQLGGEAAIVVGYLCSRLSKPDQNGGEAGTAKVLSAIYFEETAA